MLWQVVMAIKDLAPGTDERDFSLHDPRDSARSVATLKVLTMM
jgi:hypothetical protein